MRIKSVKKGARTLSILLSAVLISAISAGLVYASSEAGTSGAQFLKIGAGSRASAMADAYTAAADDIYSVYYNPAGLTRMQSSELAAQHVNYFQDSDYNFLAFAYPFQKEDDYYQQAFGISIYNFKIHDIERRTEDTDLASGLFDSSDMAYAFSYAYRPRKDLGLGANLKYIRGKIDDVKASAVAVDLGAQYKPIDDIPLNLGLSFKNIGSKLKYGSEGDPLPFGIAFGAAYNILPELLADIDVVKYRDADMFVSGGAEYSKELMEHLAGALRIGYTTHYKDIDGLKGLAAGAGLRYSNITFDFAWVPFGDLGNTFRYTLSARF